MTTIPTTSLKILGEAVGSGVEIECDGLQVLHALTIVLQTEKRSNK